MPLGTAHIAQSLCHFAALNELQRRPLQTFLANTQCHPVVNQVKANIMKDKSLPTQLAHQEKL